MLGHQVVAEPGAAPAQVLHLGLDGGQALLLARVQVAQLACLALVLPGQMVLLLGGPAHMYAPAEHRRLPGREHWKYCRIQYTLGCTGKCCTCFIDKCCTSLMMKLSPHIIMTMQCTA